MKKILLVSAVMLLFWLACGGDTESPNAEMFYPDDGDTVWATIYVTAKVTDNEEIDRVEFYFADTLTGTSTTPVHDSLYQYMWPTGLEVDHTYHTIYAKAYDVAGNEAITNSITVFIDNEGHWPRGY